MAEPWIRVHANISEKRVVLRASDQLRVSINEAIGLLTRFWGAMSRLGHDGFVVPLTDREIEAWAGWRGKRGAFAAFIRESHTDAEGRVNEWDEYAGALEDRRAKDRDRQRRRREVRRMSRGQPPESHADRPRDVTHESVPARAERNETKRNDLQSVNHPAAEFAEIALADRLGSDAERAALSAIVFSATSAAACTASLKSMLAGNDPATAQPTVRQFGQALIDYAANGERWNAALFRGYLKRAALGERVSAPQKPPNGANGVNGANRKPVGAVSGAGSRNDAVIDAWLAEQRAKEASHDQSPEESHGE